MSEAGTRGQSLLSLLVSLVALSLVVGVGLASGGKIDSSGDDGWVTGPAVKRELAQIERQRAYRASRQGIDERAASQSAYRGLDDRAALRLMRHAFGRLFRDDGSRLSLRQGERVARFASDHSAVIEDAGGHKSLAYSPTPLAAKDASGTRSGVDFTPERHGRGWQPRNSSVPLQLGADAPAGIDFASSGIAVKPAFASAVAGTPAGSDLFYANVAPDTDFKAGAAATGASFALQLRSPASPESFDFTVDLPEGARLEARHDPAPEVRVVRNVDETLLTISPPAAFDAQGAPVPVDYQVSGNVLRVQVSHRNGDFAYPIAIDPTLSDSFNWETGGETNYNTWTTRDANWSHHYQTGNVGWGAGLNVWNDAHINYPWGTFGMWYFQARGNSFFTRADLSNLTFWDMNPGNACVQAGIGIPWTGWDGTEWVSCTGGEYTQTVYGNGTPGNIVAVALSNNGLTGANADLVELGTVVMYYGDNDPPKVHPAPASAPTAWTEGTGSMQVALMPTDAGLGVKSYGLLVPQNSGTPLDMRTTYPCNGHASFCYSNAPQPNPSYSIDLASVPEGVVTLKALATDALDNPTAGTNGAPTYGTEADGQNVWNLKLDRSPPTFSTFGGDLAPGSTWVDGGSHRLTFNANDQYSGVSQAGVTLTGSTIGRDDFTRTTSNGWGTANVGGTWLPYTAPDSAFATDGSQATASLAQSLNTLRQLGSGTAQDVDARVQINFPTTVPPTGETMATLGLRYSPSAPGAPIYQTRLVRDATGELLLRATGTNATPAVGADVDTGMRYAPGTQYWLRAAVTGISPTRIQIKAWPVGSPEPSTWAFDRTDSSVGPQAAGGLVLGGKQTGSATALVLGLDNYSAADLGARPYQALDNHCTTNPGCPTTSPATFDWDTTNVPEGQHTFTATAVDPFATGQPTDPRHAGSSSSWTVSVDTQAPVATGTVSGSLWNNRGMFVHRGSYDLTGSALDPGMGSGVRDIQVLVDGVEDDAAHSQQTCSPDCPKSASRTYTFNTAGRADRSYHIQMIAHDRVSHPVTIADFTVKVDNTDPLQGTFGGDLAPPAAGSVKWVGPGTHTLTHTPTDAYSGVLRDSAAVAGTVGSDSFARTTASGWGTADRGGAWQLTYIDGGTSSTDGTAGSMFLSTGQTQMMQLATPAPRDVDMRVRMKLPPVTDSVTGGVFFRHHTCSFASPACHMRILMTLIGGHVILRGVGTSGFLWNDIDTGMTFSAADRYDLRARVLGGSPTTVQAKLWKDGTPEPTAWAVTKTGTELVSPAETVAGGIGLRGGYGGAGSGEIRFDKFSADDITPAAPYEPSCDATAGCPTTAPAQTLTWDSTGQDEGTHQVVVRTADAVHQTVVSDWNVGLDRTAPTDSNATGSMSQRNGAIGAGPQTLGVDTADSLSGVQAVDLFVNGTSVGHVAGSCSAGQCTTTKHADFTWDSSNTSGRVTVMVRVTDQVGNKFDDTWALAVDSASPTIVSQSGNLAPQAGGVVPWVREDLGTLTVNSHDTESGVQRSEVSLTPTVTASDAFGRTTTNGWGSADRGGAWSVAQGVASSFSTDGTRGLITVPSTPQAIGLPSSLSTHDVDARVDITFPAPVAASGEEIGYLLVRRVAGHSDTIGLVRSSTGSISIRSLDGSGAVITPDVPTGLSDATGGTAFRFRLRVTGANPTSLKAKAWVVGTAEPAAWMVDASDSTVGPQGSGQLLLQGVETTPKPSSTIAFDNLVANDLGGGVRDTKYVLNSSGFPCTANDCPNDVSHTFNWTSALDLEGVHTISTKVYDAAGHTAQTTPWTVGLDRTLPSTSNYTGSLSQRGGSVGFGTQTLSLDAADAVSGVKSIDFLVNGTQIGTVAGSCTPAQCASSKHADFTWDSTGNSGQKTITVRVTDVAGNQFNDSWNVLVDATPPTLALSGGLLPPVATSRNLHMASDDADGGVSKFQVWVDPSANPSAADASHTYTTDCFTGCPHHAEDDYVLPLSVPPGQHTILVRVTDSTGLKTEKSFSVTVVDLLPGSRAKLGLEHWFQYDSTAAGGSSNVYVNAETGNAVWHSVPIVNPGRGLSTVVNLTYNSLDRGGILGSQLGHIPVVDVGPTGLSQDLPGLSYGQAGVGFSIGVSGPTRLNEPLGGVLLAQAREENLNLPEYGPLATNDGNTITMTDADGTVHTFTRSGGRWIAPPGLNMTLRRYKPGGSVVSPIDDKWAMTRSDGVTHFFDNLGYLTSTRDRNGNTLSYTYEYYDALTGRVSKTVDDGTGHNVDVALCNGVELGKRITISTGLLAGTPVVCAKRVAKVTDAGGRDLRIYYRNRPITASDYGDPAADPFAVLRHAWYQSAEIVGGSGGQIDHIVDHANRTYQFTYDSDGFLTDFVEAAGTQEQRSTHLNYEAWQPGLEQVGQDRQLTEVVEDRGAGAANLRTSIRYVDPQDRRAVVPAPGVALRSREVCGVTPRNDSQTALTSTKVSGQDCRTAQNDRETTYQYTHDGSGQTTQFSATKILNRSAPGGGAKTATTVTDLDNRGRPATVTDPLGTKTVLTWDDDLNSLTGLERGVGPGSSETDATKTEVQYDKTNGTGVITKQTVYPAWPSTSGARVTNLAYQFSSGVYRSSAAGVDDSTGQFVADLTEIQKPKAGTGSSFEIKQDPSGNFLGNVKTVWDRPGRSGPFSSATYDASGQMTSETDQLGQTTTYDTYDANGLPTQRTDRRGKVWNYLYDSTGNLTALIDPRAVDRSGSASAPYTTTYTYDAFDRPLTKKAPKLSDPAKWPNVPASERYVTTSHTFDRNGNVTQSTDGAGTTTTVGYTPMDQPSRVSTPGANGNEVTDYVYDDASRLIARVDPGGDHSTLPSRADQDAQCTSGPGSSPPAYTTRYCLDDGGRRVAAVRTSPTDTPNLLVTSYAFDRVGNVVGMVDPLRNGGKTVGDAITAAQTTGAGTARRYTYGYDKAGEQTDQLEQPTETDASGQRLPALHTQFGYDANGNRTSALPPRAFEAAAGGDPTYGTTWTYDDQDRLIALKTPAGCTAYSRRADGRVTSVTAPNGTKGTDCTAPTASYTYDTTNYTYDGEGDVTSRSIPYVQNQYGRSDSEFAKWKVTYWRDAVGNPQVICDAQRNAAGPACDPLAQAPPANGINNTFFDTGALQSTDRPSFYRLDWKGSDAYATNDPGRHFSESDSGADLQITDGGPTLQESGNRSRTAAASDKLPALPTGSDQGKFGSVERMQHGDMLPDAGSTQFEYDGEMRITAVVDAAGTRHEITYDPQGRMASKKWMLDPGTPIEHDYHYDLEGNLHTYQDGRGQTTTFGYDGYDRRKSETAPGSFQSPSDTSAAAQVTTYGYDENGNVQSRQTARGSAYTFQFRNDSLDRLTKEQNPNQDTWSYLYDGAGNTTAECAPLAGSGPCDSSSQFATRFTYDKADRMATEIAGFSSGGDATTTYGYDDDGNRTSVKSPGSASQTGASPDRRLSTTDFDGRDLPWRTTTSNVSGGDKRTTIQEFDPNGSLRRIVDPAGIGSDGLPKVPDPGASAGGSDADPGDATWHATVREHDQNDLVTDVWQPWSKPAGTLDGGTSNPSGPSDAEPGGDSRHLVQTYQRAATDNPLDRVTSLIAPHLANDDKASKTSYDWYADGWVKSKSEQRVTDPSSTAVVPDINITYGYDQEGNQVDWRTAHAPTSQDPTPEGRHVTRSFYPDGTLKRREAFKATPAGDTTVRCYDYFYDPNRSLTRIEDFDTETFSQNTTVSPSCAQGTQGSDTTTTITRDPAEREQVVNEGASARDTQFAYDANGNVKTRKADGNYHPSDGSFDGADATVTTFQYDPLNREIQTAVNPVAGGATRTTTTSWWDSGDMESRTKSNGTVENTFFNPRGEITQKTRAPQQGATETQGYTYDANGNRTQDERGTELFNPRNQLVRWTRGSDYANASSVPGDPPKSNTTVTYTRTDSGDIQRKEDSWQPTGVLGPTVTDFNYTGDRLMSMRTTRQVLGSITTDTLDSSFTYDDLGSVMAIKSHHYGATETPPAAPPDGPASPADCKEVPNSAEAEVTRYCFDEFERMILSRGQGVDKPTKYVYDGLDRRALKTVDQNGSPQTTTYSYIGTTKLLARETGADGKVKTYDYDSAGRRLGQAIKATTDLQASFRPYATDANGSVTALENNTTGATGSDTYLYDPYGDNEKVAPTNPGNPTPPTDDLGLSSAAQDNPFRFEGFYYDAGVKSYDMEAREYRPDTAHFLTQDRFESAVADDLLQADPLTQNRYAFAGGNPVNNVEFDGHHGWLDSALSGVKTLVSTALGAIRHTVGAVGGTTASPPVRAYNVGGGLTLHAALPPMRAAVLYTAAEFIRNGPCLVRSCSNQDRLGLTEEAYRRILNGVNPGGLVAFGSPINGSAESVDDLTNFVMTVTDTRLAFAAGRALFSRLASKETSNALVQAAADDSGPALARRLGIEGETRAGIDQAAKVRIPSATGTAAYRVPDALTDTTLTEVKNVSRLGFTRQLQDFTYYAAQTGRRFDLVVRQNTHLTRELEDIIGVTSSPIHLVRLLPGG